MNIIKKTFSLVLSVIMAVTSFLGICTPDAEVDTESHKTNYTYIFVHGLMGWGEYDLSYKFMPYWGMFGGDLMKYLRKQGFDCRAASVAGTKSAHDRACELYAQLTGTVVDYGKAHSEEYGHERYGEDFTGRALLENWNSENKINLLGHSFGGATIRVFAHLMAKGSAEEQAVTDEADLSGLFTGGKEDWIYSLTALAAPHNGTSSYCTGEDSDEEAELDTAAYDMYIDNALELNESLSISDRTYYFSIPCSMTTENEDGTWSPDESRMEVLFVESSAAIGAFKGTTRGGYLVDESWRENDGLVNTLSAKAPFSDPSVDFNKDSINKGVWNIMPTYDGDHMSLQGGFFKINDVKSLYVELLTLINNL